MTTIDNKFSEFCDYVEQITGRKTLKERAGATPQLNEPFIAINLIDYQAVEKDTSKFLDVDPANPNLNRVEVVRGLCLATFIVSAFSSDALQCLQRLVASFNSTLFIQFSEEKSFGFSGYDGPKNISAQILDSRFENRAELTVRFYIPIPVEFSNDFFTSDKITVVEEDKKYSETFTVSEKGIVNEN